MGHTIPSSPTSAQWQVGDTSIYYCALKNGTELTCHRTEKVCVAPYLMSIQITRKIHAYLRSYGPYR